MKRSCLEQLYELNSTLDDDEGNRNKLRAICNSCGMNEKFMVDQRKKLPVGLSEQHRVEDPPPRRQQCHSFLVILTMPTTSAYGTGVAMHIYGSYHTAITYEPMCSHQVHSALQELTKRDEVRWGQWELDKGNEPDGGKQPPVMHPASIPPVPPFPTALTCTSHRTTVNPSTHRRRQRKDECAPRFRLPVIARRVAAWPSL